MKSRGHRPKSARIATELSAPIVEKILAGAAPLSAGVSDEVTVSNTRFTTKFLWLASTIDDSIAEW